MDDNEFLKRCELLRIGRYDAESEPVGDSILQVGPQRPCFGFSVWLDIKELAYAAIDSGETPGQVIRGLRPSEAREEFARVIKEIPAFLQQMPSRLREWLTYVVCWDSYIRSLDFAHFRRLLESESDRLPLLLGVPAVQERIERIRREGKSHQREALARIIAGRVDGRPLIPDDRRLYHRVQAAERELEPIISAIRNARNAAAVRPSLEKSHPHLMANLGRWKLIDRWLLPATKAASSRRKKLSVYSAACEYVGQALNISPQTVEKRVSNVKRRRRPRTTA